MRDNKAPTNNLAALSIVAGLFFILGFNNWINGSLTPYLKQILLLTPFQASLILFSFYISVTFAAMPSAWLIQRIGYKKSMAAGMAIMMIAALLFIPAAKTQTFALFLLAQLVAGIGFTLVQTAVNPYVVRLGAHESAAVRVSCMGILNKSAGVIAPIIFSTLILSNFTHLVGTTLSPEGIDAMANALVLPYLGMALFLGIVSLAILKSPLQELEKNEDHRAAGGFHQVLGALSHPTLVLGVIGIFLYVAVEVIAADTISIFALALGVKNYAVMTSYTMAFMVVGYCLGIFCIPRFLRQQTALAISASFGTIMTLAILYSDSQSFAIANVILTPWGGAALPNTLLLIATLGFANAIVWPVIWPLALSGLGKLTSVGSGLLIMGIAGGAFGPLLWSIVGSSGGWGMQGGYIVMLPCYLFILFYALKGHKIQSWK